jgi:hypothetical protein
VSNALNISTMFRNNFEPELVRLVCDQATKDNVARAMQHYVSWQQREPDQAAAIESTIDHDSLPKSTSSHIKRFIDIDHAFISHRKGYLWNRTTKSIDDQIAKFQKVVDENTRVLGALSRKSVAGRESARLPCRL